MIDDAVHACEQVIFAFYAALDRGDDERLAALMKADGVWHRLGVALRGRPAVRAAVAARPSGRETAHIVSNVCVDQLDRDSCTMSYRLLAYDNVGPQGVRLASIRRCVDTLAWCDNAWLIAEKTSQRQLPPESP